MASRILIAFPLYQTVPVSWFFSFCQLKKDPLVGTVATKGVYLNLAMKRLVEMAFEQAPDWDRLLIYEHDMIPPDDALLRIAQYGPEHDIVGSCYFKHEEPHHIMAWMQVEPPLFSPLTSDTVKTMVENPALYEVDGVAMGFTSISRRVFENWDPSVPMWDAQKPLEGHDLWFCHAAKQQGFKVWMDSGLGIAHLTEVPIGYHHHVLEMASHDAQMPRWQDRESGMQLQGAGH